MDDGLVCNEELDSCESADCTNADADMDAHRRIECGGFDCDDSNPTVYDGAVETCDAAGLDEDCNPSTIFNEGPGTNDGDRDRDGYADAACYNVRADGTENRGTDCDDMAPTINPDGVEGCDLRDNDCDDLVDEGVLETFYRDADGDGAGDEEMTMEACTAPAGGWVLAGGDCDDARGSRYPGATESCDELDNDCDSAVDEAPAGMRFYRDPDLDGYGDPASSMATCGTPPAGWVTTAADCWDGHADEAALARPGADWQDTPFCRVGTLCGSICGNLDPSGAFCTGNTGTPEWDYDCSGTVETESSGGEFCYMATTFIDCDSSLAFAGFDDPDPNECGQSISYVLGCSWDSFTDTCDAVTEERVLRCR